MTSRPEPSVELSQSEKAVFDRLRAFIAADRRDGRPLAADFGTKEAFALLMAEVEGVRAELAERIEREGLAPDMDFAYDSADPGMAFDPWHDYERELQRVYLKLDMRPSMVDRTLSKVEEESVYRDTSAARRRPQGTPRSCRAYEDWRDWWRDIAHMFNPDSLFAEWRLPEPEPKESDASRQEEPDDEQDARTVASSPPKERPPSAGKGGPDFVKELRETIGDAPTATLKTLVDAASRVFGPRGFAHSESAVRRAFDEAGLEPSDGALRPV